MRKYRNKCLCGHSKFYYKKDINDALGNYANYDDVWCTYIGRGYPSSRAAKNYYKNINKCIFCGCELGISKSGKPYIIENFEYKLKTFPPKSLSLEKFLCDQKFLYFKDIFNMSFFVIANKNIFKKNRDNFDFQVYNKYPNYYKNIIDKSIFEIFIEK